MRYFFPECELAGILPLRLKNTREKWATTVSSQKTREQDDKKASTDAVPICHFTGRLLMTFTLCRRNCYTATSCHQTRSSIVLRIPLLQLSLFLTHHETIRKPQSWRGSCIIYEKKSPSSCSTTKIISHLPNIQDDLGHMKDSFNKPMNLPLILNLGHD